MNKAIIGFPNYLINENSEVTNVKTGKKLKGGESTGGYLVISLCKDGKTKTSLVHRLIYETFIGQISAGLEIDHIDGNRTNNTLLNLRLVTHHENLFNRRATKGYTFNKRARKWYAQISADGKMKYLGCFETEEEARSAYLKAKSIYHIIQVRS